LEGGHHTKAIFFRGEKGKVFGFPSLNLKLIEEHGAEEAKLRGSSRKFLDPE